MQSSIEAHIARVTFGHAIKTFNIGKFVSPRMIYFPSVLRWCMVYITLLSHSVRHTLTMAMCILIGLCNIFSNIVLRNMFRSVVSNVHISMFMLWSSSLNLTSMC